MGDPPSRKSIETIIWSKNVVVPPEYLNKPVLLKYFRLNCYRTQLSLSSVFRSEIELLEGHHFREYEGRVKELRFDLIGSRSSSLTETAIQ